MLRIPTMLMMERANPMGSRGMLNAEYRRGSRLPDDSKWFRRHPNRAHRLRPPFPGEVIPIGEDFVAPPGWEIWLIILQIAPGVRVKNSVCVEPTVAADAAGSEALTRAMRELLVVHPKEGVPVAAHEVAELAMKYCREKMN